MSTLAARAEMLKLARLLHVEPEELAFLEAVPVADLVALREQTTEVLFSAHAGVLTRLVAASRLLPTPVAAAIGERAFGPGLSARIAGLLDPDRAVDMAARLPIDFLTDVAVEIDPRRASAVIARIPAQQINQVTAELVRRGEYVTMGRFVGHLAPDAIAAAVDAMDDAALLQVAFVLEEKSAVAELIDLLGPERSAGILRAATEQDLWAEVLDLVAYLRPDQVDRFLDLPELRERAALARIVVIAREAQLWPQLLPLVLGLPDEAVATLGELVADLGLEDDELERLREAGEEPALRPGLARLAVAAGLSDRLGVAEAAV